jgi:hypothetical protein
MECRPGPGRRSRSGPIASLTDCLLVTLPQCTSISHRGHRGSRGRYSPRGAVSRDRARWLPERQTSRPGRSGAGRSLHAIAQASGTIRSRSKRKPADPAGMPEARSAPTLSGALGSGRKRSRRAGARRTRPGDRIVADAVAPGEAARRGKQSCRTGWLHLPAGSGRGGPVARWESVGGAGWLVGPRPADDVTTPSDDLAVIQDEDRDGPLAAELLDLRAVARIREPGPRPQAPALDPLDLVPVPGVVKRLRCAAARMGERRRGSHRQQARHAPFSPAPGPPPRTRTRPWRFPDRQKSQPSIRPQSRALPRLATRGWATRPRHQLGH